MNDNKNGIVDDGGLSDDDDEEVEEISQETVDQGLLEASRTGDIEQVLHWLSKKGDTTYMKDGWNPMLLAACNGNEELVRILMKHGGVEQYLPKDKRASEQDSESGLEEQKKVIEDDEVDYDPFIKP